MSQERTEAVVLRGVDFSETSRIVTFLTPDRGRIACLAQGARRARSPLTAVLNTFHRLEIVYYYKDSREVQRLSEASLLDAFTGLRRDCEKVAYAAFPLEIAYKTAQPDEPSEDLYEALIHGLKGMELWTGDIPAHASWQVLHLIAAAGFAPNVDCDGAPAGFALDSGVVPAGETAERRISRAAYDALRAMASSPDVCPETSAGREVFELLRLFVTHQLETSFRSLRVIDQMFR